MTVRELIDLAQVRLAYLARQRETATRVGDVAQVAAVDAEIAATQETLTQLRTLQ
jgi:hypothetical protein